MKQLRAAVAELQQTLSEHDQHDDHDDQDKRAA